MTAALAPSARVCLAIRPDLVPAVAAAVRARRPAARLTGDWRAPGDAEVLLLAPHELEPADVDALVCGHGWRWIHLASAGADFVAPHLVPDGAVLTRSARAYAAPLTEYVVRALVSDARPDPPWSLREPPPPSPEPAPGVYGQRLGVVGLGAIGRSIVAAGLTLGMDVRVLTRRPRRAGELPEGARPAAALADLRDVDHLVLALGLTPQTRGLVDAAFLRACRPGLHLVNVSRGALVDHAALAAAVRDRGLRATLDVTDPEPLPADHPLRQLPGVRISPHVAWQSGPSDWAFADDFLRAWQALERGERPEGAVDYR